MGAFMEDYTAFLGNGEKNELGEDLETFLNKYDAKKYDTPSVTADILVFQYPKGKWNRCDELKVLMIKRKNHPSIGMWALPGGFAEMKENLEDSAKRELFEETGLMNVPVEQLYTWGNYDRDPRTRVITVSYLALIEEGMEVRAGDDAAEALWMEIHFFQNGTDETEWNGVKKLKKTYELQLTNIEKGIELSATITYYENQEGYLKEPFFKVNRADGIAFDHPCFIAQALLKIDKMHSL